MKELRLEDIAKRLDAIQDEVARVVKVLNTRPERAIADAQEPIAVSAADVARMLSIPLQRVYQMHHALTLNGFRPYPNADLKFLVSEVREVAEKMSSVRAGT